MRWFKSRKAGLKKKHPTASDGELVQQTRNDWTALKPERQLLWVRKVRAAATGGNAPTAPRVLLKAGDPVPPVLWGHHKGSEVLLAERGLLPLGGLRATCDSAKAHAADNRCCCKRLLSTQAIRTHTFPSLSTQPHPASSSPTQPHPTPPQSIPFHPIPPHPVPSCPIPISARFPKRVLGTRTSGRGWWAPLPLSPEVPLRAQLDRALLGRGEEVRAPALRLHSLCVAHLRPHCAEPDSR